MSLTLVRTTYFPKLTFLILAKIKQMRTLALKLILSEFWKKLEILLEIVKNFQHLNLAILKKVFSNAVGLDR